METERVTNNENLASSLPWRPCAQSHELMSSAFKCQHTKIYEFLRSEIFRPRNDMFVIRTSPNVSNVVAVGHEYIVYTR